MGSSVSREITEEEAGLSVPRSATLPAKWTLPRGLGLDSNLSVKLTKSKKLDDPLTKGELDETKVEIVKNEQTEEEVPEETTQEFVEKLLITLLEDALANFSNTEMSRTLPSEFRDLKKSRIFGKRFRQSFRALVPSKKTVKAVEKTEEEEEKEVQEALSLVSETSLSTTKNSILPLGLSSKRLDMTAKKKYVQSKIENLFSRGKKPKKETLQLINSILDDIIRDAVGEKLQHEAEKKEDDIDV